MEFSDPNCTWYKIAVKIANCGLECNAKLHHLKLFLVNNASLAPPLLHGDIVNDATSLISIHDVIRSYCQLALSESTFITFNDMYVVVTAHSADCNMGNVSRVYHILQLILQVFRRVK